MSKTGSLRLSLVDVFGAFLDEPVDILLTHQGLTSRAVVRDVRARGPIRITGLLAPPDGLYRLEIDAPSYRPVQRFVRVTVPPADIRMVFAVNPHKVLRTTFPPYEQLPAEARRSLESSSQVLGFAGQAGRDLYGRLDDLRRAGLLNILAKSDCVRFADGSSVLSYYGELLELRGDRFFVRVPHELREQTRHSVAEGLFEPVTGILHRPPDGFTRAGSFKTGERYGNLHLTFFANDRGAWVADVDIDDAAGIEHIFQVARNALRGQPTHPYDIHQILVAYQEIDPGYRFLLRG